MQLVTGFMLTLLLAVGIGSQEPKAIPWIVVSGSIVTVLYTISNPTK